MSSFSSLVGDGGGSLGVTPRSAAAEVTEVSPIKEEEEEEKKEQVATVARAEAVVVGGNGSVRHGRKLPRDTRDWSSLPQPAAQLILMGLRLALGDAFSFAAVCKAWRSVFRDCKRELFWALPPLLIDSCSSPDALGRIYSLVDKRFFLRKQPIPWRWIRTGGSLFLSDWRVIGVSHGYWIITALCLKKSKNRPVFLMDPLSPESRIDLPPASVCKLGKATTVDKFSRALMTAPPTSPDCVVVATEPRCIWYCRPGDTAWVRYEFNKGSIDGCNAAPWDSRWVVFGECQVAVLGLRLYALARSGKVVVMELLFPQPRVAVVHVEGLPWKHNALAQLVESDGEILYVADEGGCGGWGLNPFGVCLGADGRPRCAHWYIVRRLDLPARKWVTLDTLGKRSIFLPRHWRGTPLTCFAAARWGGGEDCIYADCLYSSTLLVWSMKDATAEHHPLPEERPCYDWLVPSFCYE